MRVSARSVVVVVGLMTLAIPVWAQPIGDWPAPATWTPPRAPGVVHAMGDVTYPLPFIGVTPCRVVDTRNITPPVITLGPAARTFTIKAAQGCGVPTDAQAVSLNVAIAQPLLTGRGFLALYPTGTEWPGNATINFASTDVSLSNGAIVPLGAGATDELTVQPINKAGTVHLILDVNGYYK